MPDIKAYSADNMVHVFPEGTDPNVIDRTMKRYAQTGGMEDPEAQAHQSLVDKMQGSMDNEFPAHDVDEQARRHPEQRGALETGSSMAIPETLLGAAELGPAARSGKLLQAVKTMGKGAVRGVAGGAAGGYIGGQFGGDTGRDVGRVAGAVAGAGGWNPRSLIRSIWQGGSEAAGEEAAAEYAPYKGSVSKPGQSRGTGGSQQFGRPGVDLQRGKISPVPSAAAEPEPVPHEPYGGGSATREKLVTRVRGRGEAGTPQYGRPGVDLQRGGISPVPEGAPGETLTEKMGAGGGAPPKSPQEPAQGRPRGLKRDKPVSTGGLPSRPRTPSMQKLVDRINELKGPRGKNNMSPDPNMLDAGVGTPDRFFMKEPTLTEKVEQAKAGKRKLTIDEVEQVMMESNSQAQQGWLDRDKPRIRINKKEVN